MAAAERRSAYPRLDIGIRTGHSELLNLPKSEEEYYKLLRQWKECEQSVAEYLRKVDESLTECVA
ncbi:MAG: hypothetical protein U7123_25330 [Potamolinea sp.]